MKHAFISHVATLKRNDGINGASFGEMIQVMQFGRIDGNAYTLDFQYPFSAVQAFAVALANVTQRLKWTAVSLNPGS